eukprot:TRINITY_DN4350_c1_g1_i3.p1 TRINITY_DN4350_c1_g1~~TRINITY_DN4350_c1_g1_i3.p1  ORF type:complete len:418 (-),score=116.55 TRINITY_DN4350_c1_g1_i3:54-1307(-)
MTSSPSSFWIWCATRPFSAYTTALIYTHDLSIFSPLLIMMRSSYHTIIFALAVGVLSPSTVLAGINKCTGDPPTYNGLPCASTTRYWNGQTGACGCGEGKTNPLSWQWTRYTAAASQPLFDDFNDNGAPNEWCGEGCGACYELTPTGDCPFGESCSATKEPITIMITNRCPSTGNEEWCTDKGKANSIGMHAHFDIMDYNMAGLVSALQWNNPVVTYRRVACGGSQGSPSCEMAESCKCNMNKCAQGETNKQQQQQQQQQQAEGGDAVIPSPVLVRRAAQDTSEDSLPSDHDGDSSPSSSSSSSSSSSTTSAGSGECSASAEAVLSDSWPEGGRVAITITNTGSKAITGLTLRVPEAGASSWNLLPVSGDALYTLPSWSFISFEPSSQNTAAGYTYFGDQPESPSIQDVTCEPHIDL